MVQVVQARASAEYRAIWLSLVVSVISIVVRDKGSNPHQSTSVDKSVSAPQMFKDRTT